MLKDLFDDLRPVNKADDEALFRMHEKLIAGLLLASGLILVLLLAKPFYNWDLIPYVGLSLRYTGWEPKTLRENAYAVVEERTPPEVFRDLIGEGGGDREYRTAVAADRETFLQQLPFYSVKPVYPAIMALIGAGGKINLVSASLAVSRASYFMLGLVLFLWLSNHLRAWTGAVFAGLIMLLPWLVNQARYSTPDALSVLTIVTALFLLLETKHGGLALMLLSFSVAIRPDNILFVFPLAIVVSLSDLRLRRWALLSVIASVTTYFGVRYVAGGYGWSTLFYFSFVRHLLRPAEFEVPLSFLTLLKMVYWRSMSLFGEGSSEEIVIPSLIMLLGIVTVLTRYQRHGHKDVYVRLTVLLLLFTLAHWSLFPGESNRLLVAPVVCVLVSLILTLAARGERKEWSSPQLVKHDDSHHRSRQRIELIDATRKSHRI